MDTNNLDDNGLYFEMASSEPLEQICMDLPVGDQLDK